MLFYSCFRLFLICIILFIYCHLLLLQYLQHWFQVIIDLRSLYEMCGLCFFLEILLWFNLSGSHFLRLSYFHLLGTSRCKGRLMSLYLCFAHQHICHDKACCPGSLICQTEYSVSGKQLHSLLCLSNIIHTQGIPVLIKWLWQGYPYNGLDIHRGNCVSKIRLLDVRKAVSPKYLCFALRTKEIYAEEVYSIALLILCYNLTDAY